MYMKHTLLILLACCFPVVLMAQDAQIKFWVNGEEQSELMDVSQYSRITVLVEDGAPRDGSVVYEFGPVKAYKLKEDGSRGELLRVVDSGEVMNIPMLNFTLNPPDQQDLLGYHWLEVEWVKRYNADKTVTTLELSELVDRGIKLFLHQ